MTERTLITVLVPVYNEAEVLEAFVSSLDSVAKQLPEYDLFLLFVNDGSTDTSLTILERLSSTRDDIGYISLSRNFGKEAAMTAGLDHAPGDAVAVFDADLQDPPELLLDFVKQWRNGYDVVFAQRVTRDGESRLKKSTAWLFYRLLRRVSSTDVPPNTGDCRLLSRRAVDSLNRLREQNRFMKGLFAWVGYPSIAVPYRRAPRVAGTTKFNYWKLWNFALDGLTSFTEAPLKLAVYTGFLIASTAFMFGFWIVLKTVLFGEVVQGFPTLMVTILFLGGLQIFFIGIVGEYIGRIFRETKNRPIYLIDRMSLDH